MLEIMGASGIGLVWGWLAVRLCQDAGWARIVRVLLSMVVQSIFVVRFGAIPAVVAFGITLVFGALICAAWLRMLRLRYG